MVYPCIGFVHPNHRVHPQYELLADSGREQVGEQRGRAKQRAVAAGVQLGLGGFDRNVASK